MRPGLRHIDAPAPEHNPGAIGKLRPVALVMGRSVPDQSRPRCFEVLRKMRFPDNEGALCQVIACAILFPVC